MSEQRYDGPERRKYFRYNIIFSPRHRAKLIIDQHEFEVLDFSEGGLRFLKDEKTKIDHRVKGKLIYSDGKSHAIEGKVAWDLGKEIGLQYV